MVDEIYTKVILEDLSLIIVCNKLDGNDLWITYVVCKKMLSLRSYSYFHIFVWQEHGWEHPHNQYVNRETGSRQTLSDNCGSEGVTEIFEEDKNGDTKMDIDNDNNNDGNDIAGWDEAI